MRIVTGDTTKCHNREAELSRGSKRRQDKEKNNDLANVTYEKSKRKIQGVPQLQATALPRHQEEEETDKTKQAQIEKKTYKEH